VKRDLSDNKEIDEELSKKRVKHKRDKKRLQKMKKIHGPDYVPSENKKAKHSESDEGSVDDEAKALEILNLRGI
jgi:hypothetical protein